jgi:hypothetical protein
VSIITACLHIVKKILLTAHNLDIIVQVQAVD